MRKTCQYEDCPHPAEQFHENCRWHTASVDKSRDDTVKAQLEEMVRNRQSLRGFQLSQVRLAGANLMNANLEEVNLIGAHLERANLSLARLDKADLSTAHYAPHGGRMFPRAAPVFRGRWFEHRRVRRL